jgi:hypothetical protein
VASESRSPDEVVKARRFRATRKQVQANRENARKSTGPRTLNGKSIARLNALRHGLTANVVLHLEDDAEFQAVLESYWEHYQPLDVVGAFLVTRVAKEHWRLKRFDGIEQRVSDHLDFTDEEFEKDRAPSRYDGLYRHDAHIQRSYYRALHELERYQAARQGHVVPLPVPVDITR